MLHVPFDVSEAMLDGSTIPGMSIVEIPFALRQTCFPSPFLERRNKIVGLSDVRFIPKQALSREQRRAILAEDFDIRGDAEMWPAVPDDVAAIVTDALHLTDQITNVNGSDEYRFKSFSSLTVDEIDEARTLTT